MNADDVRPLSAEEWRDLLAENEDLVLRFVEESLDRPGDDLVEVGYFIDDGTLRKGSPSWEKSAVVKLNALRESMTNGTPTVLTRGETDE